MGLRFGTGAVAPLAAAPEALRKSLLIASFMEKPV